MSIVSIKEDTDGRRGSKSGGGFSFTRTFRIITNDPEDDAAIILADDASDSSSNTLPVLFSQHPNSTLAVLDSFTCDPFSGDRLHWVVKAMYKRRADISDNPTDPTVTKPTEFPPNISYGFSNRYQRVVENSYFTVENSDSGDPIPDPKETPTKAILNSAGQPFDPPLVQDDSSLRIDIQRNETREEFDPDTTANRFKDTLNISQITIAGINIGPLEGRMIDVQADKKWDQENEVYWDVSYIIEVRRSTHKRSILDAGYYQLASSPTDFTDIERLLDSDDEPITEPVPLNGAGTALALSGEFEYLDFTTYFPDDWSQLGLPTNADDSDPVN